MTSENGEERLVIRTGEDTWSEGARYSDPLLGGFYANGDWFSPNREPQADIDWHADFQAVGSVTMFPGNRPESFHSPDTERLRYVPSADLGGTGVNTLSQEGMSYLQQHGWELFNTTAGRGFHPEWHNWEMIRDLVQNALDETENFRLWRDSEANLWIEDSGSGMPIASFMTGTMELKKTEQERGKFGSGMKLSILTALREGYSISFASSGENGFMGFAFFGSLIWMGAPQEETLWIAGKKVSAINGSRGVSVVQSDSSDPDASWIDTEAIVPPMPASGTRWLIRGYHGELYKDYFATTLEPLFERANPNPKFVRDRIDQIFSGYSELGEPTPPGLIYGRDIYMRALDPPTELSYNLWGFEMAEDRHDASQRWPVYNPVEFAAAHLWAQVGQVKLIEWLVRRIFSPKGQVIDKTWERKLEIRDLDPGYNDKWQNQGPFWEENGPAWEEVFLEVFGDNAVIDTGKAGMDFTIQHFGLRSIILDLESAESAESLRRIIDRDDMVVLQEKGYELLEQAERGEVPDTELTTRNRMNLQAIRVLNGLLDARHDLPVPVIKATVLAVGAKEKEFGGVYIRDKNIIYVDLENLQNTNDAINVFIHEYAHYWSQEGDGSKRHTAVLSRVGEFVVALFSSGLVADSQFYEYVEKSGFHWKGLPPTTRERAMKAFEEFVTEEPRIAKPGLEGWEWDLKTHSWKR